jgi:hypothetical protein
MNGGDLISSNGSSVQVAKKERRKSLLMDNPLAKGKRHVRLLTSSTKKRFRVP